MRINDFLNRLKSRPAVAKAVSALPPGVKTMMRSSVDRVTAPSTATRILWQASQVNDLLARYLYEQAFTTPRFQDSKRLIGKGFKVYSQHDEDGIIEEIFNRIGTTNQFFVEFGTGDGLENCTTYCLLKGWSGAWIDASTSCYKGILENLDFCIREGRLAVRQAFITMENIEALFASMNVPAEFDLLSIDIDRNDFWIWKAIERYRPRVVVIEYNASLKQTASCTVPYSPTAIGGSTNYYGASLKALEILGREKGYRLVGCNYTGVSAFFVRNELVGDSFAEPFTSENHYEPPRYFVRMPNGHKPAFGPYVTIHERGETKTA